MNVIYAPITFKADYEKITKLVDDIKGDKAVVTVSQFKSVLEKINVKVKGLVLGCDAGVLENFKGGTVIFIGDGLFHALNIKNSYPDKKVLTLNPYSMALSEITDNDIKRFKLREVLGREWVKNAKSVGIIISTKPGQNNTRKALEIKKELEKIGKNVYLFMFDNVDPDEFLNFKGLDLLINTACPRITMDDFEKFPVRIIDLTIVEKILI
ncbi:2-(3-amino-3-carboxypropyl)histidine synthase [Candidatus Tiddalikarchaeum anstoanum]|nr:2-(3-amino-3-carboxypropyl)histidine synthase [Candidatus Tiddalikarchaeum anstoanum]